MERIRTLIVDDEPAARAGIRELLADDAEVVVAGECSNGREAVAAIQEAAPDLLFLDVQMPELDGFGVLREVGTKGVPSVVFVTAYDQYALRAFEVHALDYLLKPFSDDRFRESLERAKAQVRHGRLGQLSRKLQALLDTYGATPPAASGAAAPAATPLPEPRAYLERLVVKSGGKVTLLRVGEIEWIDADGDYARIHVGKAWHLLRETMKRLEQQLDPARFVRIHRSTIVNLEKVKELQPFFRGEYVAVLQNGVTLKLSRGYRANLEARLGRAI
jgi:two-component system LytT family response regulator